jgi:undecaprenyl-diphosphatase
MRTRDMRFSKKTNILIFVAVLVPLALIYADEPVLTWIREFHKVNPDIDRLLRAADKVMYYAAHGTTMIVGAILVYLYGRYVNQRFRDIGKSLFIGLAASGISVQIIKHLIGRARPRVSDSLIIIGPSLRGGYDSFPSGHSAMAFCLAAILSRYYPRYWIPFYIFAVLEGLARIDGTSHFPADVLAGAFLGIVVAKLVEKKISRANDTTSKGDTAGS